MIGCGDISGFYLRAAAETDGAAISQVMDVNPEFARSRGEEYGLPYTTDYAAVLADDSVDAVIISVPHYLHAPLTLQALDAGKHVLCDKPIATKVEDGLAMIRKAERCDRRLAVSYAMRCTAETERAQQLVQEGVIGDVIAMIVVEASMKPEAYWTQGWSRVVSTDWRRSRTKAGGGCMLMNASHTIDRLCHITGRQIVDCRALASTYVADVEVEDMAAAVMCLDNNAMMSVFSGSSAYGAPPRICCIQGTNGQISLAHSAADSTVFVAESRCGLPADTHSPLLPPDNGDRTQRAYATLLGRFAAHVRDGEPSPCPPEAALMVLEAILGAFRSSDEGVVVPVNLWHTA
jgi:predicted dehydrogenase